MSVIVVVLPNIDNAKKIKRILQEHGFQNVFACNAASLALQTACENDCGVVISGYHLKDMYYLELAQNLPSGFELLLIGSAAVVADAGSGILSLTMPLKVYDLVNTVGMILNQTERRYKKNRKPKVRSEKEQNYIRNAKLLLMERNHLTEEEAFRYIQKSSMNNSTNMVETAQMILSLLYEEA